MRYNGSKGFTLMELLIVIAIVGIISAIAAPPFLQWQANSVYRGQARTFLYAMQRAKSEAISRNLEHRAEFEVASRRYRLTRGDRSAGTESSKFGDISERIVFDWVTLPRSVALRTGTNCDSTSDVKLHFNPNGSSNTGYVCVMDAASLSRRFKIGVGNAVAGRPVISD